MSWDICLSWTLSEGEEIIREEVTDEFVNLCLCTPMFSTYFLAYIWILYCSGQVALWNINHKYSIMREIISFNNLRVITKVQRQGVTMVFTRQVSTWRLTFQQTLVWTEKKWAILWQEVQVVNNYLSLVNNFLDVLIVPRCPSGGNQERALFFLFSKMEIFYSYMFTRHQARTRWDGVGG